MLFGVIFFIVQFFLTKGEDELLAVTLIHRHGDRMPCQFYPNDPYKNSKIWDGAAGDLTKVGKKQMYELGKWLRLRYDNFLSKNYEKNEIYIFSSDHDRCLVSASALLASLYPVTEKEIWNKNLKWTPVPIHTNSKKYDDILYFLDSCEKYKKLIEEKQKLKNKENTELYNYVTINSGKSITNLMDAGYFWDTLNVEEKNNLTLPEWTKSIYPEKIRKCYEDFFKLHADKDEITKLASGRFFHEILKQFESISNKDGLTEKFKIYSGHDINIFIILSNLNVPTSFNIPLAAALLFELRKTNENNFYVQLVYKTNKTEIIYNESIQNFTEILKNSSLTEEEHEKECNNT